MIGEGPKAGESPEKPTIEKVAAEISDKSGPVTPAEKTEQKVESKSSEKVSRTIPQERLDREVVQRHKAERRAKELEEQLASVQAQRQQVNAGNKELPEGLTEEEQQEFIMNPAAFLKKWEKRIEEKIQANMEGFQRQRALDQQNAEARQLLAASETVNEDSDAFGKDGNLSYLYDLYKDEYGLDNLPLNVQARILIGLHEKFWTQAKNEAAKENGTAPEQKEEEKERESRRIIDAAAVAPIKGTRSESGTLTERELEELATGDDPEKWFNGGKEKLLKAIREGRVPQG